MVENTFKEKIDSLNSEYHEYKKLVKECEANIEELIFRELIWLKGELTENDAFELFHDTYAGEEYYCSSWGYTKLFDMIEKFRCYTDFVNINHDIEINFDKENFQLVKRQYFRGELDEYVTDFFPFEIFDRSIVKELTSKATLEKKKCDSFAKNLTKTYTDILSNLEFSFGKDIRLSYKINDNNEYFIVIEILGLDGEYSVVGEIPLELFIRVIAEEVKPSNVINDVISIKMHNDPIKYSQYIRVLALTFEKCVENSERLNDEEK